MAVNERAFSLTPEFHSHAADYDGDLAAEAQPTEETTAVEQPLNKWQQPLSIAQGMLSLVVTGLSFFGLLFAAHGRFLSMEWRQTAQDKTNVVIQQEVAEMRKDLNDRSRSDSEFRRAISVQLERLATQSEWMTDWIKKGGEKK